MAAIAAVIGMGLRGLLDRWLGDAVPFVFAAPAVVAIGWYAGLLPALLTAALSVAWLHLPWLRPTLGLEAGWKPSLYFLPGALLLAFFAARLGRILNQGAASTQVERGGTLAWLRAVMAIAVVVPAFFFSVAAWTLYEQAVAEGRGRVDHAARIGEEHALKVFETQVALLNRLQDSLGHDSDEGMLAREAQLHPMLKRMAADLPQLQGIFVIDSIGRLAATNRVFPAPRSIGFSDREFFRHHQAGGAQPFVSTLLTSRTTGEPFFDVSLRRTRLDGSFGGTLSASIRPGYFAGFYGEIANGAVDLSVTLSRSDGALLARWPPAPGPGAGSAASGTPAMALNSSSDADSMLAQLAFTSRRTVGSYPVLVTASMDWPAVLAPWFVQIVLMLALTLPTAAGLMYIAWIAFQKTQRAFQVAEDLREESVKLRRVEESLRQAQKLEAVGRLTGGVAHDFNNLLMVIGTNLFLHKRQLGAASDDRRLSAIERAVGAGAKLTRQLLSFSRRQPLQTERVWLQQLIPGIVDLVKPIVGAAIALSLDVDPATPPVEVDTAELELAILNLAINAKDAMPGGGRLHLRVARADHAMGSAPPGNFVLVSLSDSGSGIEPELLERVFEPFFTTKPAGQGTGLGLSQVHGFCARAGGAAVVNSRPGEGTTVHLYLPASHKNVQAEKNVSASPGVPRLDLRVLLVEDNAELADATREVLRSMGCTVHRVGDADEATAHLKLHAADFDVLLSDIVMPGSINGIELASRARDSHPGLALVLMSGFSEFTELATTLNLDVLPKPCAPEALAAALQTAVGRARQVASNA